MNDLISRQAAIDAFEALDWYHVYHGRLVHGANSDLDPVYKHDDVFKTLRALPSAQPQRWIPVTERLPEYGTEVVTINKDDEYEINHVIDEEDGEWFFDGAVAWMPLPDPWKGEQG